MFLDGFQTVPERIPQAQFARIAEGDGCGSGCGLAVLAQAIARETPGLIRKSLDDLVVSRLDHPAFQGFRGGGITPAFQRFGQPVSLTPKFAEGWGEIVFQKVFGMPVGEPSRVIGQAGEDTITSASAVRTRESLSSACRYSSSEVANDFWAWAQSDSSEEKIRSSPSLLCSSAFSIVALIQVWTCSL